MRLIFSLIASCLCLWLGLCFGCCITGLVKGDLGDEEMKIIVLVAILCGLTFPNVRITLAAFLEGTSDYLYDSAKNQKTFIPYWLKKVRED